ncbi:MAG: FHA domain-containing protein [Leptolyngbyaceae cyanobacterium SL_5_9]|nr:FHA domain-containing protein [Leptolyngbyaceae cyanobacterium SL_5_9]NJO73091.1 FHA domain-containing protein [Leptolyngbyaceae cyanobacterium RM1_406_9]
MIICPNCAHTNPETAVECEACYTPLPAMIACPNCGASVSAAAHFCGQCGYDLQHNQAPVQPPQSPGQPSQPLAPTVIGKTGAEASTPQQADTPDGVVLPPDVPPALTNSPSPVMSSSEKAMGSQASPDLPESVSQSESAIPQSSPDLPAASGEAASGEAASGEAAFGSAQSPPSSAMAGGAPDASTRLQQTAARLFHVQSNSVIELPMHLNVIHIGKPNGQIPPDIDLSGLADSDIVSRVHADIRVEGDAFYLEDLGSSNGTYVNNLPLQMGDRHRLRPGDRIALGKGDKVSFLFQLE